VEEVPAADRADLSEREETGRRNGVLERRAQTADVVVRRGEHARSAPIAREDERADLVRCRRDAARALAQELGEVLARRPTAFLDLPRRVELMGILRRLARESGRAVLLSTHDLDLALRGADQLWLFQPGGSIRVGTPEELVLDGAFQAAFHGDGVAFDPHAGAFKFHHPPVGQVNLVGGDLPALWTRRALEREGFTVNGHDGPRSAVQVEVLKQQCGQTLWRVRHVETWQDFPTLSQAMSGVKACLSPPMTE